MTTRYLSGTYSAGYDLNSRYTGLVIEATGSVGGTGVYASFNASIQNYGVIKSIDSKNHFGIELKDGGSVTNGSSTNTHALVSGFESVFIGGAAGTVANFGTINGGKGSFGFGVALGYGGSLTNGSALDTTALIVGYEGVVFDRAGEVANFGTIETFEARFAAVYMGDGGTVTNGSIADTTALIDAGTGIQFQALGTAVNFATIVGGIELTKGGTVINGSASDNAAMIEGFYGVLGGYGGTTVVNFGTIHDPIGGSRTLGVLVEGAGMVTNGSEVDTAALMDGIDIWGAGVVANFGTIRGPAYGVVVANGTVTNGSAADTSALIDGNWGVTVKDATGTISNFGTIRGGSAAIILPFSEPLVTNGSTTDTTATIVSPYWAVKTYRGTGAATIMNYGTIASMSSSRYYLGVTLGSGGTVTNGSAGDSTALIAGGVADYGGPATTVTNFGTISGNAADAVDFHSGSDVLVVEAGSIFLGEVAGGGGTLELAGGTGTITRLGGAAVLFGAAAMTFGGFGSYDIDAGGMWTLKGPAKLAAGQSLSVAGALVERGSLTNAGTLAAVGSGRVRLAGPVVNTGELEVLGGLVTVVGDMTGTGMAVIKGGKLAFLAGFDEDVTFAGGGGRLKLAQSQAYAGTISGFSRRGYTSLDLTDIAFVSADEATFSGTNAGGILTVSDGTHTARLQLAGDFRTTTFTTLSDGFGGVVVAASSAVMAPSPTHLLAAAMAGLVSNSPVTASPAMPGTATAPPALAPPRT
jgi:hypothetical protein